MSLMQQKRSTSRDSVHSNNNNGWYHQNSSSEFIKSRSFRLRISVGQQDQKNSSNEKKYSSRSSLNYLGTSSSLSCDVAILESSESTPIIPSNDNLNKIRNSKSELWLKKRKPVQKEQRSKLSPIELDKIEHRHVRNWKKTKGSEDKRKRMRATCIKAGAQFRENVRLYNKSYVSPVKKEGARIYLLELIDVLTKWSECLLKEREVVRILAESSYVCALTAYHLDGKYHGQQRLKAEFPRVNDENIRIHLGCLQWLEEAFQANSSEYLWVQSRRAALYDRLAKFDFLDHWWTKPIRATVPQHTVPRSCFL